MALVDNEILIVVRARDEAAATLKKVRGDVEQFGDGVGQFLGKATQQASLLAAAGFVAVGAAAVDFTKSAIESENVQAQLNAVLASTKSAAGLSINALNGQSAALERVTKFSDEAVGKVQALLLTFTDLKGPVVKQATETVLDMATALGEDTSSASIQLGKALQDPILGITALRRVGVNFSDAQKEVIQKLVDTGQKAKAQQLILKELNTEFGGSAVAAGKTFSGQMTILANRIDDVKEVIGGMIIEAVIPLVDWFDKFIFTDRNVSYALDNLESAFASAATTITMVSGVITRFLADHPGLVEFFQKWGLTALAVIPALAGIGAAIAILSNPLVLLTAALATMWQLWENNRVLFWTVIAVLGPLAAAFLVVRTAMMIGDVIEATRAGLMVMNTAVQILTGTNIAAAASAGGLRGAVAALQATVGVGLGPLVLVVVGVAAIIEAINWVHELHKAWDGLAASEAAAKQVDDTFWKTLQHLPPDQRKARGDAYNRSIQGMRAEGGPVKAGESYIVGEKQAEVFVPKRDGYILPSTKMAGTTIYQTNNIYNQTDLELANRELGWRLAVA